MIIVSGKLFIVSGRRKDFLASSHAAMVQARTTVGCRDFVVAPDPVDTNRVNIYEEWESDVALNEFRGSGPDDTLNRLIERAEVAQREVPGSIS